MFNVGFAKELIIEKSIMYGLLPNSSSLINELNW